VPQRQVSYMYVDTCRMTWLYVSFGWKNGQRYYFHLFQYHKYVPLMIKFKTQGVKSKVCKSQGCVRYLTLKFFFESVTYIESMLRYYFTQKLKSINLS